MREIDLINISSRDVFLRADHKRDPFFFAQARAEFGAGGGRGPDCRLKRRGLPTGEITEPEIAVVIEPSGEPSFRTAGQRVLENSPVVPSSFKDRSGSLGRDSPETFAIKENARGGRMRGNHSHWCDVSGKAVPFQGPPRYG